MFLFAYFSVSYNLTKDERRMFHNIRLSLFNHKSIPNIMKKLFKSNLLVLIFLFYENLLAYF